MSRSFGRTAAALRPVEIVTGFHKNSEGSALYRAGGTVVLVTASLEDGIPKWMDEEEGGWLTAEYQMHPRANRERREEREGRNKPPKGRTLEIQRLVGRGLRSALDLKALGPRTMTIDCDVLEADGGTRTASVTAGFIAAALALHSRGLARVIRDHVAAASVGVVGDDVLVDLDYSEDSQARLDMNVVATMDGRLIEVQGTAEGRAVERKRFDQLVDAALGAVVELGAVQRKALEAAGADLRILMKKSD